MRDNGAWARVGFQSRDRRPRDAASNVASFFRPAGAFGLSCASPTARAVGLESGRPCRGWGSVGRRGGPYRLLRVKSVQGLFDGSIEHKTLVVLHFVVS